MSKEHGQDSVNVIDEILRYNFGQQVEEQDVKVQTLDGCNAAMTWMNL